MDGDLDLPVLLWPVSCFDRRRERPLPVYNRWYWLNWSQLTHEQAREILAILQAKKSLESPHKPAGFDETVVTMAVGLPSYDRAFLKHRKFFSEVPENDVEAFLSQPCRRGRGFQMVSISGEYFEDETGTAISEYEMMQHVSGQEFPIIVGDPESVMRLGPTSAVNVQEWTVEKANTIAQFLDVIERIYSSEWHRSPQIMTTLTQKTGESKLLEARFADDSEVMSVLAYFRQLHAGDRLMTRACDAYESHSGDGRKRWWIAERKKAFESLVDSVPAPFDTGGHTRRQILKMFMYGAGLLHSTSQHGDDVRLAAFVSQHGIQKAVMIFNWCLRDFYRVASQAYHVIRQDYLHWIDRDNLAPASRVTIPNLFEGFRSPPHGV